MHKVETVSTPEASQGHLPTSVAESAMLNSEELCGSSWDGKVQVQIQVRGKEHLRLRRGIFKMCLCALKVRGTNQPDRGPVRSCLRSTMRHTRASLEAVVLSL